MTRARKTTKADETPEFVEFWKIWMPHARHTDGRGLARDAFFAHVMAGAEPQDIIDGARCFFRKMTEKDKDFVPLSATWLNRESYTDLAEEQRAYDARRAQIVEQKQTQERVVVLPRNHYLKRVANAN